MFPASTFWADFFGGGWGVGYMCSVQTREWGPPWHAPVFNILSRIVYNTDIDQTGSAIAQFTLVFQRFHLVPSLLDNGHCTMQHMILLGLGAFFIKTAAICHKILPLGKYSGEILHHFDVNNIILAENLKILWDFEHFYRKSVKINN